MMKIALYLFFLTASCFGGNETHRYMILGTSSVTAEHWQMKQTTGVHHIDQTTAVYSCDRTKVVIEYDQAALQSCAPCAAAVQQAIDLGVAQLTASEIKAYIDDAANGFTNCP